MWKHTNPPQRFFLLVGTAAIIAALTLLAVVMTAELLPETSDSLLNLCIMLGFLGLLKLYLVGKEPYMKIGIVERIIEQRRIATAAKLAERYRGTDLADTPEALALPVPVYHCSGCNTSWGRTADRMYWVDEQPLLKAGWLCDECVDKLNDKSRNDRLNMEIFLLMLDSELGTD